MMNRYKLTYRRSRVEEYVLQISSETLDEDGVEKKVMEIWKEYGSEVVDRWGEDYSSLRITTGRFDHSSLLEVELINVVLEEKSSLVDKSNF
tara:strand:+ start:472 stop:747 length:276 start_codon:yes stop_codon:yes gene_type:complete